MPTFLPYLGLVWLLLQVMSVVQPLFNLHPLLNPLVAIFLFASLPVVFYLSWYFNISLDGIESIKDIDAETPVRFGKGKWAVLILIMSGSGYLGYGYFGLLKTEIVESAQTVDKIKLAKSIAVLPFRDQSPQQDQTYIATGLTEELTNLLGKISELKVAATSSTLALAAKNLTPMDIGKRLRVDTVVTGSVRLAGKEIKIRTELLDTSDGTTLWTESFSREFKDIFAVEEEIARSIANLLQDRYLAKDQVSRDAKTASTDAYVMFLKGREQYRLQTTESIKQARQYFERALALDPEYVDAYVALADTVLLLHKGESQFGELETEIAVKLAEEALSKALVREKDNARAYAIQGKSYEIQFRFDDAISSYNKAIAINPSLALAYGWKFMSLRHVNQHADALQALQKAYELDPESSTTLYNLAHAFAIRGRFDESAVLIKKLFDDYPQSPFGHSASAFVEFLHGNLSKTLWHWQKAREMSPENHIFNGNFLNTLVTLRMGEQLDKATDDPFYDASIQIIQGQIDQLFKDMTFQLKAHPDDPWIKFEAGWYYLLFGKEEEGIEQLAALLNSFSEDELYYMPMCSPGIEIAWAMKQRNLLEPAKEIVDRCFSQAKSVSDNGLTDSSNDYLLARINAIRDNQSEAVEHLQEAFDNGYREWWAERDPLLENVREMPEIQQLFSKITKSLEQQRHQAEALFSAAESQQAD